MPYATALPSWVGLSVPPRNCSGGSKRSRFIGTSRAAAVRARKAYLGDGIGFPTAGGWLRACTHTRPAKAYTRTAHTWTKQVAHGIWRTHRSRQGRSSEFWHGTPRFNPIRFARSAVVLEGFYRNFKSSCRATLLLRATKSVLKRTPSAQDSQMPNVNMY